MRSCHEHDGGSIPLHPPIVFLFNHIFFVKRKSVVRKRGTDREASATLPPDEYCYLIILGVFRFIKSYKIVHNEHRRGLSVMMVHVLHCGLVQRWHTSLIISWQAVRLRHPLLAHNYCEFDYWFETRGMESFFFSSPVLFGLIWCHAPATDVPSLHTNV